MRPDEVRDLLTAVHKGTTTADEALRALQRLPVEDLGFARLDTHRELRQGLPEAIYAEGKSSEQVLAIAARLLEATSSPVLATRATQEVAVALVTEFPTAVHHQAARVVVLRAEGPKVEFGRVAVISAGTSDLPVADEAAVVSDALGASVHRITDVGVAGLHRLLSVQDELHDAHVAIVVAGMEGALASLVGGITPAPVIAVPTSVGYGSAFEGLAALLAMLNSCAAGISVVNIDNGFGAAMCALRLLRSRLP